MQHGGFGGPGQPPGGPFGAPPGGQNFAQPNYQGVAHPGSPAHPQAPGWPGQPGAPGQLQAPAAPNAAAYAQPQFPAGVNPAGYAQPQFPAGVNPAGYAQPQFPAGVNPAGHAQPQFPGGMNPAQLQAAQMQAAQMQAAQMQASFGVATAPRPGFGQAQKALAGAGSSMKVMKYAFLTVGVLSILAGLVVLITVDLMAGIMVAGFGAIFVIVPLTVLPKFDGMLNSATAMVDGFAAKERLLQSGLPAQGRLLSVQQTGRMVNMNPEIQALVEVHHPQFGVYQAQTTALVPQIAIPRAQPGAAVQVRVDPANKQEIALLF